MPINREELLRSLETVAPALLEHDLVPILTCVLFTGQRIVAFNDRIGISTPLKTEFVGTIPGKTLIDTLRIVSHASEVEIQPTNERPMEEGSEILVYDALIKAGRTKLILNSLPQDEYTTIFEMPPRPKNAAKVDETFFMAIEDCLQATAKHGPTPDHRGITIIPAKQDVKLFGTNAITICYSKIPLSSQAGVKQRVILPSEFCQQMLTLGRQAKSSWFVLRDDHALFMTEKTTLFGKLLQSDNPLRFEETIKRHLVNNVTPVLLNEAQRPRLKSALELAARICDIKGSEVRTRVRCQKDTMEFSSSSDRGEANDTIRIKHEPIDVFLQASYLRDVYDRYESILLTEQCVLLSRDNMNSVFLLATYSERK